MFHFLSLIANLKLQKKQQVLCFTMRKIAILWQTLLIDENAHHIDISFDKNNKVPKIQLESSKFSSDKFKAINSISKINNLDLNSLIFNCQTKKSNNSNYNIHFANIMITFFIVVGATLIVASVINGQKN